MVTSQKKNKKWLGQKEFPDFHVLLFLVFRCFRETETPRFFTPKLRSQSLNHRIRQPERNLRHSPNAYSGSPTWRQRGWLRLVKFLQRHFL